jgi:hypothetical protein
MIRFHSTVQEAVVRPAGCSGVVTRGGCFVKQSHRDEHKTKISPGRTKAPFLQNKPTEDDAKVNQSAMRRFSSFAFAAAAA